MHRYRFLIAALTLTALTLLLTVASSPTQAAPRSIPWDCSDWQESPAVADADDARVSLILESLAANRGKAIYCAIDQSDTWTKAETWLAGRDRNERDDTVYFGESGNFRGFLAAQEGYLTDGESGVTGVSRDLIFEFPREEKKRRRWKKVTKRLEVPADDRVCYSYSGSDAAYASDQTTLTYDSTCRKAMARFGGESAGGYTAPGGAWRNDARAAFRNDVGNPATPGAIDWAPYAQAAATAYCLSEGYQRAVNVAAVEPWPAGAYSWVYRRGRENPNPLGAGSYKWHAAAVIAWSATCEKEVRRRR